MKEHYSTVVLGATWFGCGTAAALGSDVLVIDQTISPGSDFTMTFYPGFGYDREPEQVAARELAAELVRRRVVVGERVQIAALTPVLAKWCIDRDIKFYFSTDLIAASAREVTFQAVDGFHTVTCDRVIDARPRVGTDKFITALVDFGPGATAPTGGRCGDFELYPLLPENQCGVGLVLPAATGWVEARRRFIDCWNRRGAALADARLVLTAARFAFKHFDNPVQALDCGLARRG